MGECSSHNQIHLHNTSRSTYYSVLISIPKKLHEIKLCKLPGFDMQGRGQSSANIPSLISIK